MIYKSVKSFEPNELALELDLVRFRQLDVAFLKKSRQSLHQKVCEFIVAFNALGNVDADIWLIDMTERQIKENENQKNKQTRQV